ncbi:MAG TPA: NYN domain-containing protein [Mycobacterium sp.]|nr:NYN domain-containing protein [Mycobacterium sp.]
MTLYVYVDNSNVWIEGTRLSAVRQGMATDIHDAMARNVTDHSWSYDFGKLYQAVCPASANIGQASLFGSRPPQNDSLWELARRKGFEVKVFDRNVANKEKEVDVAIATQIMADSYERMQSGDKAVLVAGDRDYLPVIESPRTRRLGILVAFWDHATARELKTPAADFFALDGLFDFLTLSVV